MDLIRLQRFNHRYGFFENLYLRSLRVHIKKGDRCAVVGVYQKILKNQ